MRKCQINIVMELFDGEEPQKIAVYADANNPWEAVSAGFFELATALQEQNRALPPFGVKEHYQVKNKEKSDKSDS